MTLHFAKKHIQISIALVIVLALIYVGIYFLVIKPKKVELETLNDTLMTEYDLLGIAQAKIAEIQNQSVKNSKALQLKMPVESTLENYILDLEKAELVSNSFISSMTFGNEDIPAEVINQLNPEQKQAADSSEGQQVEGEVQQPSIPAGIKRITAKLEVESPGYQDLETFLSTLEGFTRVSKIDTLTFTGNDEVQSLNDEQGKLKYSVTVSSFYYPSLSELLADVPAFEIPEPSNKLNPLVTSYVESSIKTNIPASVPVEKVKTNTKEEPNMQDEVVTKEVATNSGTYIVKKGDTLYQLAIVFYNSNKGVQKIRQANNIEGNVIFVGQKLVIPQ